LGMMKQEMDLAVKHLKGARAEPEQIAQAETARDMVYEAIPFQTKDVLALLRQGGRSLVDNQTTQILQTSERIKKFEQRIQKMSRAQAAGEVAPAAPAAPTAAAQESENKRAARAAIAAGAPREAVIQRLQEAGEDISGL